MLRARRPAGRRRQRLGDVGVGGGHDVAVDHHLGDGVVVDGGLVEPDGRGVAALVDPVGDGVRLGGEGLVEVLGERSPLHDDEAHRGDDEHRGDRQRWRRR